MPTDSVPQTVELLLPLLDSPASDRYSGLHGMPAEERVAVVRKDKASFASCQLTSASFSERLWEGEHAAGSMRPERYCLGADQDVGPARDDTSEQPGPRC